MIFFSNPPIGWSENGLREGDLLEEKSAYGYPPSPPPLTTYDITGSQTGCFLKNARGEIGKGTKIQGKLVAPQLTLVKNLSLNLEEEVGHKKQ